MLHGLRFRSKVILKIVPDADGGEWIYRAPTKIHLMERPPGRKARAKKTLCGIKIDWRPFGQRIDFPENASCLRCLASRDVAAGRKLE